jgi:hypothetical protein
MQTLGRRQKIKHDREVATLATQWLTTLASDRYQQGTHNMMSQLWQKNGGNAIQIHLNCS